MRSLAGGRTDRELLAIARRVVAAQVLIGRAQFARHSLMAEIPEAIDGGATRVVADVLARVARLERYECSALAKRRFAFRDFADAWAKASLPSPTAFLQNEAKISKESNDEET